MRDKAKVRGINLLPRKYIQAEETKRKHIIVGTIVILETCLFIGTVVLPPKIELGMIRSSLEQKKIETQSERFIEVNKIIEELAYAKQEVKEWIDRYGGIKTENFVGAKVLDSLTSRVPNGVVLDRISISPGSKQGAEDTININCTARDSILVMNYATILESVYGRGTVTYTLDLDEEIKLYKSDIKVIIPKIINNITEGEEISNNTDITEGGGN